MVLELPRLCCCQLQCLLAMAAQQPAHLLLLQLLLVPLKQVRAELHVGQQAGQACPTQAVLQQDKAEWQRHTAGRVYVSTQESKGLACDGVQCK